MTSLEVLRLALAAPLALKLVPPLGHPEGEAPDRFAEFAADPVGLGLEGARTRARTGLFDNDGAEVRGDEPLGVFGSMALWKLPLAPLVPGLAAGIS